MTAGSNFSYIDPSGAVVQVPASVEGGEGSGASTVFRLGLASNNWDVAPSVNASFVEELGYYGTAPVTT